MARIIHWFRRDLRLYDNTALQAAAQASAGQVLPVFVLDKRLLNPQGRFTGAARVRFLLEALRDLDETLRQQGSRLIVRRGDPPEELLHLARESGAAGVYWNCDYTPYASTRDAATAQALTAAGCTVKQFKDAVLVEPDELFTQAGTPYTVYTPYARRWQQYLAACDISLAEEPRLCLSAAELPPSQPIPTLHDLGLQTDQQTIPGGAAAGQHLLHTFTDLRHTHSIASYQNGRNILSQPATSRLSAHLHLGTVSVRHCIREAQAVAQRKEDVAEDVAAWIGELAWRDFYIQILAHYPRVLQGAFKQQYAVLQWENNAELFAAWCAGRTGYPVVDAAMRQLASEAWMHNRARMIVASFLTKDLLIDWRWGERFFMQNLVDGDLAANNGGWQWAAGTGTDAQPYFRIFNPTSQGKNFDPQGEYVRRYLPELVDVPQRYIHQPWMMPQQMQAQCGVRIGHDYPAPVVDHAEQRQHALALYKAARGKESE